MFWINLSLFYFTVILLISTELLNWTLASGGPLSNLLPQTFYAKVGETVNMTCSSSGTPLSDCQWHKSTYKNLWVQLLSKFPVNSSSEPSPGYFYNGERFEEGQCSLSIKAVKLKDYSTWRCRLFVQKSLRFQGIISIIEPQKPGLLTLKPNPLPAYFDLRENPLILQTNSTNIACSIIGGIPAPTFRWFIDDQPLESKTDEVIFLSGHQSQSVLSYKFTYIDNGKKLRCVVDHQTFTEKDTTVVSSDIIVYYKPRAVSDGVVGTSVHMEAELGSQTTLYLNYSSNPKPLSLEWNVNGTVIKEGKSYLKYLAEKEREIQSTVWEATLRIETLEESDLNITITLSVENVYGTTEFSFYIFPKQMNEGIFKNSTVFKLLAVNESKMEMNISSVNLSEMSNTNDVTNLYVMLIIVGVFMAVTFVFVIIYLKTRQSIVKVKLSHTEIDEFLNGVHLDSWHGQEVKEEALTLPYATEYELNRENVIIERNVLLRDGCFGLTFKGRLVSENRPVAVKLVDSNSYSVTLTMLLSEIKILIHVGKHPHVDSIIGAFTTQIKNGFAFFVSDLCENGSLENYLRTNSTKILSQSTKDGRHPKSLEQLVMWSYHIASGMEHITSNKVIHGDLATKNVMLDSNLNAKITDLGLSRHSFEYKNYVENNEMPTPWRWMAPESLNHLIFSIKTDVWAYGVTLWEIFSFGAVPFSGVASGSDFMHQLENGHRLLKPEMATTSIYYEMLKCWNGNSDERPTFTELKTTFKKLYTGYVEASTLLLSNSQATIPLHV